MTPKNPFRREIGYDNIDSRESTAHLIKEFGCDGVQVCCCGVAHPNVGELVQIPDDREIGDENLEPRVIPSGKYFVRAMRVGMSVGTSSHFLLLENLETGQTVGGIVGYDGGVSMDWRDCKKIQKPIEETSEIERNLQQSALTDLTALLLVVHTPDKDKRELCLRIREYITEGTRGRNAIEAYISDEPITDLQIGDIDFLCQLAGKQKSTEEIRKSITTVRNFKQKP